jgi:hypothetical protein
MTAGPTDPRGGAATVPADVATALGLAAVVVGLLIYGGGIWRHVGGLDLHAHLIPKYEYAARAARDLRLPLWNPQEFCGVPLLATVQAAMLYPPVVALFALLPSWSALQGIFGVHVFILALGTLPYLRRRGIGRPAAALAALVAVAGYFTAPDFTAVDHPNFISCMAWFPAMLLCFERAVEENRWRWVGLLALAAGAQWFAGYPDFPMDSAVLLGTIALVDGRAPLTRKISMLAVGLGLGAGLAAIQLFPMFEGVQEGPRPGQMEAYASFRELFAFRTPAALGDSLLSRYGAAGLALAALAAWRGSWRSVLAWTLALAWTLFALHRPLNLLYELPPFEFVRMPQGWAHLSPLFVAFAVAAGAQALAARRRPAARGILAFLAIATVVHGVAAIVAAPTAPRRRIAPDYELGAQRAGRLAALRGRGVLSPRFLGLEEIASGAALRHGLPSPTGYEYSFPPRRIVQLLAHLRIYHMPSLLKRKGLHWLLGRTDLAALLGIGVVVVPEAEVLPFRRAGFVPVATLPPNDVALYRAPVPRARLVHRVLPIAGEYESIAAVVKHAGEAESLAIVEEGAFEAGWLAEPPPDGAERVDIVAEEPERIVIEATVASPALLVLLDSFYPGWEATVDGHAAPILRADHAFRGVLLEPGERRIVFRYAPRSLRVGAVASAGSLSLTLALLFTPWGRRRTERVGGEPEAARSAAPISAARAS